MLTSDSIHVWRIRLDSRGQAAGRQIASWRSLLSLEELRRADAFRADEHRNDYITAHAALRFVLGTYVGVSPDQVSILARPEDSAGPDAMGAERHRRTVLKPRLLGAQYGANSQMATWPDVRFNLSHTSGAALVGVVLSREVGIDIEWLRPMEDLDAMARSITSGEELDQWESLDAASRFDAFYRVWTRKESYLKAIGLGLYRSLQDVTVPVLLDDSSGTLWEVRDRAGEGHWSGRDIPVGEGYSASICWEGAEALQLVVRDLDLSGIAGGG